LYDERVLSEIIMYACHLISNKHGARLFYGVYVYVSNTNHPTAVGVER
jgi:hypothetical protein